MKLSFAITIFLVMVKYFELQQSCKMYLVPTIMAWVVFSQRNTFQLVLASDRERSFAIFLYEEINFGPGAVAGFDAGNGSRFYNIPATFQNLNSTSNVNRTGVYIFRIDSNNIIFPCKLSIHINNTLPMIPIVYLS